MRLVLTTMTCLGLMVSVGCYSKRESVKEKPGDPDPNTQHWKGSSKTIKDYRFPDGGQKKPNFPGFKDKTGGDMKKQQEKTPPK